MYRLKNSELDSTNNNKMSEFDWGLCDTPWNLLFSVFIIFFNKTQISFHLSIMLKWNHQKTIKWKNRNNYPLSLAIASSYCNVQIKHKLSPDISG